MPAPFTLPLAASSTTQNAQISSTRFSRARFISRATRKRKRSQKYVDSSDDGDDEILISSDAEPDLAAEAANALSLTQDEIIQRKLAGLGLSEPYPPDELTDFPHRGLPVQRSSLSTRRKGKSRASSVASTGDEGADQSEIAEETEDERVQDSSIRRPNLGPKLRLQHFSVLTTILHRCLNEGDLERAGRAWAMLIRMQVSGKAIDLKMSGYWGIGAELLVRSLDVKRRRSGQDLDSDTTHHDQGGLDGGDENGKGRWGTKEGLEKVISYYERLILQFPYRRHHENSVSALDFWPPMVGCEIYGIETERKEGFAELQKEEDEDDGDVHSGSESDPEPESEQDENQEYGSVNERLQNQRMSRRGERRWIARDEIRKTALAATQKLALRLDELMSTPPYADSHNILRLRANIAMYLGDLSVPLQSTGDGEAEMNADRRYVLRERRRDYEDGLKRQRQEYKRARVLFNKVLMEKGDLDGGLGVRDVEMEEDEQMEM